MIYTIGEIANILIPYCQRVELTSHNNIPLIRAYLTQGNGFVRGYMYVVQNEDGSYSACDNDDDIHGKRFFPTGTMIKPFVSEHEVIEKWNAIESSYVEEPLGILKNATAKQFFSYMCRRLYFYEVTTCSDKTLDTRLVDLGFNNSRLKRAIEKAFDVNKCYRGTIEDMLDIVSRRNMPFVMANMKHRETTVVAAKLRELGVHVKLSDSRIMEANLVKQIYN